MVQSIKSGDRDKFVAVLAREQLVLDTSVSAAHAGTGIGVLPMGQLLELVGKLIKWGRAHGRLMEAACNRGLSDAEELRDERIQERAHKACQPLGITPVFSGDPRGATLKLKLPSGIADDWGNVGLCVPGS